MDRKEKILEILLQSKDPVTTIEISKKLDVSSRTIRSDLNQIESLVLANGCRLMKKPHVGIWIEGSQENKNKLFLQSSMDMSSMQAYSKEYRISGILAQILLSNSRVYPQYFAETFYVSRSTIDKDLLEVEKWLSQHNLTLVRKENQGLYIDGNEKDIRNAISNLAGQLNRKNVPFMEVVHKHSNENEEKIKNLVTKWSQDNHIHLNEVNINNLTFHILIMMIRIHQQKTYLTDREFDSEQLKSLRNAEIDKLIELLEQNLHENIPEDERYYLVMHITGMLLERSDFISNPVFDDLKELAQKIAAEFIGNLEKIIPLGFAESENFKQSLFYHLLPTIYRLKYGLNLYNPLLNEIKMNYTSSFSIASIINSSFKKYLNVTAGEEEIAFIAIHISVVVESKTRHVTVAIVCPMGVGVSQLLRVKLQDNFPDVQFINVSYTDRERLEQADVVLYTSNDFKTNKPSLKVNPLLLDADVQRTQKLIQNFEISGKNNFSYQTIIYEREKVDKITVLQDLSNRLRMSGCVTSDFLDGVLKREKMGSTEVGNGIVLTHGFHEHVIKTQFAFCKCKYPILWNQEQVDFIVMLAIEKKDAKDVMKMNWLYKMLIDKKVIDEISNCEDEKSIYEILTRESHK
ncbi:BglG family transcription antiterminator [uncultured Faecalicoccus sp.]|uniref:BglG family transcription antiterminator n=1 Tax=uncultured Faecalicoccus sp. TaxID=1971760 RepID=UPI002607E28C|nr:BglG family transcription antiterminator [uncultured Faecalicoccus sp.]